MKKMQVGSGFFQAEFCIIFEKLETDYFGSPLSHFQAKIILKILILITTLCVCGTFQRISFTDVFENLESDLFRFYIVPFSRQNNLKNPNPNNYLVRGKFQLFSFTDFFENLESDIFWSHFQAKIILKILILITTLCVWNILAIFFR